MPSFILINFLWYFPGELPMHFLFTSVLFTFSCFLFFKFSTSYSISSIDCLRCSNSTASTRGRSFWAITDPLLSQVFSSSVPIPTVSPGFNVDRRFWDSGSVAVLVVEGLNCGLTEGRLVRIGRWNNLWAGENPFSSSWEFKNSIDK